MPELELLGAAAVVVIILIALICYAVWATLKALYHGVRAIYHLLPWVAERDREEARRRHEAWLRQEQERERQEQERQRREQARRRAMEDAKQQFEEAVMGGCFPSDDVLAMLADCDSEIPVNVKEAVEELVYGRCSFNSMTYCDAVRLIQQRQRVSERARRRREEGFGEPSGPVTPSEAYELLGVNAGCSPEELAAAYRLKVSQWHPDRLNEAMAQELREYATRRTARINQSYELLRQRVQ